MSSQSPQQHWYSYNYIYAVMPSQLPVIPVIPMDTWTIPTLQPQLQPQFQPQDQSTHLPPISTLLNLLQTQPPPLEEGTAFESWYDKIIQILQSHNLSNLVSPTIPKPPIPDINNWTTHSSNVRNWLWAALTNPQIRSISTFSPNIYTLYADDLMAAIRIHAIGSGHFPLSRAMTEFMEIKRVQFPSTEIFVHELRRRFRRYSDLGGMPTPYSALAIFLRELGNGNVPPLADFILAKEEEISRLVDPGVIVTVWDFYAACEEVIAFVGGGVETPVSGFDLVPVPIPGGGRMIPTIPMQMNLGIQAGGWDRERVMQKWPPVGMSNEEYAQRWRESQPQFIQGSCVFCERWGHGTGKCWYLVPELQPERWKPEAGIWVFGPGMSYPG